MLCIFCSVYLAPDNRL